MEKSFTPGSLGNLKLKNRWIMLAMHTGYANPDGSFSKRDENFYVERAKGGVAAITLVGAVNECAAQESMHLLNSDKYNEGIAHICDIIHEQDCKVIMQLFHAGRNRRVGDNGIIPICPSEIPSPIYKQMPKAMDEDDIATTIKDFSEAALRCKSNGVDCIEVNISAGYLLSQFLSPHVNKRTDQWGGSPLNRMKFPTEVLKAIRSSVGNEYPLLIKISADDMLGGYDYEYMASFITQLPTHTIDGVTVTGGWHEAPVPQISYHVTPGQYSYLAGKIRRRTGLPVIACNRINSIECGERIILQGDADFVGAARSFLADPMFLVKSKRGEKYIPCQGCNRGCIERVLKGKDACCAFNPLAGKEQKLDTKRKATKILIVGSGPIGLWTANFACDLGYDVTVVYEDSEVGGRLRVASKPPYKNDLVKFIDSLKESLERKDVRMIAGTKIDDKIINSIKPDLILLAIGAESKIPEIDGNHNDNCMSADEILFGKRHLNPGPVVIIGGGSVGLETAEYISEKLNATDITVLECKEKVGKDLGGLKWIMLKSLKEKNVKILTNAEVTLIGGDGVIIKHDNVFDKITASNVIYATGSKSNFTNEIDDIIKSTGVRYILIGDANIPSNVMEGLRDAYNKITNLQ